LRCRDGERIPDRSHDVFNINSSDRSRVVTDQAWNLWSELQHHDSLLVQGKWKREFCRDSTELDETTSAAIQCHLQVNTALGYIHIRFDSYRRLANDGMIFSNTTAVQLVIEPRRCVT
jgi:hypothetical protein